MDFKDYLEVSAQKINEQLDLILSDFLNEIKRTNTKLIPLSLAFINACKGGKRIRGTLVKLGYELQMSNFKLQMSNVNEIIKVGAAIEILHTAILIHDDVIDQSPARRGNPSLYQALGGGHYGISQAISIGDMGIFLSLKIITEANFLDAYKLKALDHLIKTMVNTTWGQLLDVELAVKDDFINLFKTAKYTIAGPLQIGAILAGAEEELVGVFGEFGENLGMAFQIQDDILDKETTSLDHAKALDYISKGKKIIPKLTKDKRLSTLLIQMAEYLVERRD